MLTALLITAATAAAVIGLGKFLKALDDDSRRHTEQEMERYGWSVHRDFGDTPLRSRSNNLSGTVVPFRSKSL